MVLKNLTIGKQLIVMGITTTMVASLLITSIALWQGHQVENIAEAETRLGFSPSGRGLGAKPGVAGLGEGGGFSRVPTLLQYDF
jgi:hypothetical protein